MFGSVAAISAPAPAWHAPLGGAADPAWPPHARAAEGAAGMAVPPGEESDAARTNPTEGTEGGRGDDVAGQAALSYVAAFAAAALVAEAVERVDTRPSTSWPPGCSWSPADSCWRSGRWPA